MSLRQKSCGNFHATHIKPNHSYLVKLKQVVNMGKKPEKKFRAGTVTATVWENESKEGKIYSTVSFEKGYKDAEGAWKSTNKLSTSDLPKAMVVLGKAYEHLALANQEA